MEIAIGLMGLSLTMLGLIFAYIWKSNGHLQREMMNALERIEEGQKGIAQIAKEVAQIVKGAEESQKEIAQIVKGAEEGQKGIAQMLFNQTKILEKIEGRLS
ncbi:MAG: hypothetical protein QME81_09475 [bacterium]|nr:hypothetical protein [bacterium]